MKPPASDPKLQPGLLIGGKYRVVRVIAQGGMGAISLCQHEELEQRVAVKTLLPELLGDDDARGRFIREARAAAKLQSQHVARVTDVGTDIEIGPYMVMEYLEGSNLDQLLALRGRLPVSEVVDWVLESIDAIAEAHSLGIVHRDLKPSNLFLADRADGKRVVKVLDFGISKVATSSGTSHVITGTTTVVGSPAYMAPEQLKESRSVDHRADVWSLGVVLYELLTGVHPFKGDSLAVLFVEVLEREPKDVTTHRADIPPSLGAAIMRCLRKDLDQRMPHVADLAREIAPFGTGRAADTVARARALLVDTQRAGRNGSTAPLGSRAPAPPPQQPVTASMPSPVPHARGSQPVVPSLHPQVPSSQPSIPSQPSSSHAQPIGVGARTQTGWQGPPGGPSAAGARGRGILLAFLALAMIGVLAASAALYVRHRAKAAAAAVPTTTTTLASASSPTAAPSASAPSIAVASATTTPSSTPSPSSSMVALAPSSKTLGKVPAPGRGTPAKPGAKPAGDTSQAAPGTTAATAPPSDPNEFLDRRH